MQDISAIGVSVNCKASQSFPSGFLIADFADDADPFDFPAIDIASTAMNVNGELITWSAPTPISITLTVIPNSESDKNLSVIFEANRAGKGKMNAGDRITLVASYPDGSSIVLSEGKMTNGVPGNGPSSAGRIKSKSFTFSFQSLSRTR